MTIFSKTWIDVESATNRGDKHKRPLSARRRSNDYGAKTGAHRCCGRVMNVEYLRFYALRRRAVVRLDSTSVSSQICSLHLLTVPPVVVQTVIITAVGNQDQHKKKGNQPLGG